MEKQLKAFALPDKGLFSYHIAPTQFAWVISADTPHTLQRMRWGLVPAWSKDFKPSGRTINARAETLFEKPSFRQPARQRRCLVPADSFYEWQRQPNGQRVPFRIHPTDGSLLFMAGIWDEWLGPDGPQRTFAIVTVPASADLLELHDRMPALLLSEEQCQAWLDTSLFPASVASLLQAAPEKWLTWYRISDRINKPGTDDVGLHEAVEEQGSANNPPLF